MEYLQRHVIEEFGSPLAQESYLKKAEEGLRGSEEVLIQKYFKPKSRVLDIGCGTGRTTMPLCRMGYEVIGVDITPAMIETAKRIGEAKGLNIDYEIGDAANLRFANDSFDAAIFSNAGWTQIPGKANRQRALDEVYRVLRSGGCYVFTTHVRRMRGFAFFWIKQWIRLYILKRIGFSVDEIEFGDRFFDRETSGTRFRQKQYIHIPSVKEVVRQIKSAGFELVYMERGSAISDRDQHTSSPMFYVCKK